MRILFIHAATNQFTSEYKVHLSLIKNIGKGLVESFFIWQRSSAPDNNIMPDHNGTVFYYDFGTDYSLIPRPSRLHRSILMMRRFPQALYHSLKKAYEIQPEIIYSSQQKYDVIIGQIVAKFLHIPHVIHLHYSVGPWLGKHVFNVIHSAPNLIAVSEFVRQTAILRGINPSYIYTIPNTISPNEFLLSTKPSNIRGEYHWPDEVHLIVSIGRLDPMKGHLLLFEAFSNVIKKVPKARLLVCGTSTTGSGYEDILKRRVFELNLEPYVAFAGYRSDIPQILMSADLFCLPTELEPCALVFFEAMAAGLPTIACYSGGVPEQVIHGQTGLLSYPGDVVALEENITRLLHDPDYAKFLGQAGRNRLVNEFNPSCISMKWYEVLCQINGKQSPVLSKSNELK